MESCDVLVIGAGAAGLTCAHYLWSAGVKVLVLEARDRVGGRAYTAKSQQAFPIELGAEFIHGTPEITLRLLQRYQLSFLDVCDNHLYYKRGHLQKHDQFWDDIENITGYLRPDRKEDRSIREFLQAQGKRISPDIRKIFASYVEGFQAADLDLIGEKALAHVEGQDPGELNGAHNFRTLTGYSELFKKFMKEKTFARRVHLNTVVKNIDWKPGHVQIESVQKKQAKTYKAKAVIVTLPIGILKSQDPDHRVEFSPPLPELEEILATIHMGHVQRINFEFDDRWWESLSKEPVSFLHAGPEFYFPTWWTQMPIRSSILTAWQGGPKAQELAHMSEAKRIELAFKTLAHMTEHTPSFLTKHMTNYYTHNWSDDPYSLGAYSYMGLGHGRGSNKFRRGFSDTLFFAGEALAPGPSQGTVHGAMNSGFRAAKQVLEVRRLQRTYRHAPRDLSSIQI